MQFRLTLVAALLLAGCVVHGREESSQFAEQPAIASCEEPAAIRDRQDRAAVVRFFLSELGVPVRSTVITWGSYCDGEVIYAISADLPDFPGPARVFLVSQDARSRAMKLIRPE